MNLPTPYQDFIHLSRYSRWLENEDRRESWDETVNRFIEFFENHISENHSDFNFSRHREAIRKSILGLEVMPSMRALMTAGPALLRDSVAGYNCSYLHINKPKCFDEMMYILMCGTGVGFSVERNFVEKLPTIAEDFTESETTIVVADSKIGWAKAYRELISLLIGGQVPKWDLSKIRPAGARLRTFGGRASGPKPLDELFYFTVDIFKKAAGRKLTSIECHDICCKIAEIVVVGGVRRSALISLSDLTDDRMRHAKSGNWWGTEPQRALANNSACYKSKPEIGTFMDEWNSLYRSKSGERGIFNRQAAKNQVESIGDDRRDSSYDFGTNPCSEIILRDKEFCNLSEVVVRADDTLETLREKVRVATIIGTIQSTLTNFRYLSSDWKNNCEEERLLGVSLTGIMDCSILNGEHPDLRDVLSELKDVAIKTNKKIAKDLGIPASAAITCVKPSGTVSQLVDAASGIHARHSKHYVRTVRADNKDPLCDFMKQKGFKNEPCAMKGDKVTVFSFPIESPDNATVREDQNAIEQLELWLIYQRYWCEHKPSITVSVREHEWMDVGAWVYKHFDEISGISFLPYSEHTYAQAPYQECSKEEYEALLAETPTNIDWSELQDFEKEDNTAGSQTYACSGDSCEVVDLT